jgi:hypothetical protein
MRPDRGSNSSASKPTSGRTVVESHHELGLKIYSSLLPENDAHEIGTVSGRHEVDDCRSPFRIRFREQACRSDSGGSLSTLECWARSASVHSPRSGAWPRSKPPNQTEVGIAIGAFERGGFEFNCSDEAEPRACETHGSAEVVLVLHPGERAGLARSGSSSAGDGGYPGRGEITSGNTCTCDGVSAMRPLLRGGHIIGLSGGASAHDGGLH